MYHHVDGYWKVRLVCIAILIVVVIVLRNRVDSSNYEANETSSMIVNADMLGTAL